MRVSWFATATTTAGWEATIGRFAASSATFGFEETVAGSNAPAGRPFGPMGREAAEWRATAVLLAPAEAERSPPEEPTRPTFPPAPPPAAAEGDAPPPPAAPPPLPPATAAPAVPTAPPTVCVTPPLPRPLLPLLYRPVPTVNVPPKYGFEFGIDDSAAVMPANAGPEGGKKVPWRPV